MWYLLQDVLQDARAEDFFSRERAAGASRDQEEAERHDDEQRRYDAQESPDDESGHRCAPCGLRREGSGSLSAEGSGDKKTEYTLSVLRLISRNRTLSGRYGSCPGNLDSYFLIDVLPVVGVQRVGVPAVPLGRSIMSCVT